MPQNGPKIVKKWQNIIYKLAKLALHQIGQLRLIYEIK